jgi:ATP synthase protein I
MQKRKKSRLESIGSAGKIASGLVLPILVGFFLGNYLDRHFNSAPWGTLILIMLGVTAGFGWLYRASISKDDE